MPHQQPDSSPHLPVMLQQVLDMMVPASPNRYVDGTLGAGGHTSEILSKSSPKGEVMGLDLDPVALSIASIKLASFENRAHLIQGSYADIDLYLKSIGWEKVQGILLDLGVSSMQLDQPEKGFSFRLDAPLDMRFNPSAPLTGAEILNEWDEAEILQILWNFGEERQARRIVHAILAARPLHTTVELANLIEKAIGRKSGIHPATKTFQALRIAVNGELENLKTVLPKAIDALAPGGRVAVISFHSLEDRIVKHFFVDQAKDCICPPTQPICTCDHRATVKIITRHPIEADEAEININPRSRSARLRVAERI
jgi:16S rRNA (cytosine1402-N4)-methyltransferase